MKSTALAYLSAGWRPIPVVGKIPTILWDEFQVRAPTEAEVDAWTWNGIAIVLGRGSSIFRVDADGTAALQQLEHFGGMPETAEFITPSGGHGWLLQHETWVTTKVIWQGKGAHEELRVQSDGAYTVVPPSPGYSWVRESPVARAPRWLLNWYAERALRETPSPVLRCDLKDEEVLEALSHISPDEYDTWLRVGMALHDRGSFELWETWSQGSTKFKPGECARKWATFYGAGVTVATIVHFARQGGWKPAWSLYEPLTEGGNANVLARSLAGRASYSPKLGWLAWDGRRWSTGSVAELQVQEAQKDALRVRREGAVASLARVQGAGPEAEQKRKQKVRTIAKVDSLDKATSYKGSRDLARSAMPCDWECYNQRPSLLNFLNGTLDLETGSLRPHNPADLLTTLVPHEYDSSAHSPAFSAFLERSLPDPSIREYLRLKVGSTLLGETRKELLILWGPDGDNGKTVIVELTLAALGTDYSVKCPSDLLLARRSGDDDRNTVMLYGKRFAAASETNEGARLNEAMLKELTGGDRITSRYLFHEKFTFPPTHDIVYVTNHKPTLRGTDDALWNRIKLVEFARSFPPGHPERVEGLREALLAELPGFLTWAASGCVDYVKAGRVIVEPEGVKQSGAQYRQEHNPVAKFLEERKYRKTDGTFKIRRDKLMEAFKTWNASNGHPAGQSPTGAWLVRMMTTLRVESDKNYYFLTDSPEPIEPTGEVP